MIKILALHNRSVVSSQDFQGGINVK